MYVEPPHDGQLDRVWALTIKINSRHFLFFSFRYRWNLYNHHRSIPISTRTSFRWETKSAVQYVYVCINFFSVLFHVSLSFWRFPFLFFFYDDMRKENSAFRKHQTTKVIP